jgi:tetratricopeptide (TPR) repeat protein
MISCMCVVYLAVSTLPAGAAVRAAGPQAPAAAAPAESDPDVLYRDRERAASAAAAEGIWAARVAASAADFESAWKLARTRYWLGTNGPGTSDEKKRTLERGIEAARVAMTARPGAAAGHFWMAANMGALADAHGLRQGIKYRGPIKTAIEAALKAQPSYLHGSPDRALGRWYYKVPGLFGGDLKKAEAHLRAALTYKPDSVISLLFLAETLIELDRKAEARATLQAALDAPPDPDWLPEDTRFKAQARQLLARWR